jgi:suppressor of fused protein SUFU
MTLIDHGKLGRREPVVREGDRVLIEAVGSHLATHFGEPLVIHDRDSRWVHLDLFVCPATEAQPFSVISTCGMAERPLTTAANQRVWTELIAFLPLDWPTAGPELARPAVSWPFTLLRWLARVPHQTGTGFAPRESFGPIPYEPADQRPYPYEGAVFLDQPILPPLAMVGREVRFLAMCPIFADELAWIRRRGTQVFLDAFAADAEGEALLVEENRPSYAPVT